MEVYDLIMLAVLVLAVIFGARKGLAWQVASLSSIFASYFVAYRFRGVVAPRIDMAPPWNTFVAMLLLYIATSILIWWAFRIVAGTLDRVKLRDFDRHAGAVLGFGRGLLWCLLITLFAVTLLGESARRAVIQSRSGHYIAQLLDRSDAIMPGELHQVLGPYLQTFESRLSQDGDPGDAPRPAGPWDPSGTPPGPGPAQPGGPPPSDPGAGGWPPRWSDTGDGNWR